MKGYQLEICIALQHDIKELSGQDWELDEVCSFWMDYSDKLAAGFLGYEKGDIGQLKWAIELMESTN